MRDTKADGLEHVRMLYIPSQIIANLFSRSMSPGPFVFSVVDGNSGRGAHSVKNRLLPSGADYTLIICPSAFHEFENIDY